MKGPLALWAVCVAATPTLWGLASNDPTARQSPVAPRVEGSTMRVYLGTYTRGASEGIYVLEFDPASGRWASGPALAGHQLGQQARELLALGLAQG